MFIEMSTKNTGGGESRWLPPSADPGALQTETIFFWPVRIAMSEKKRREKIDKTSTVGNVVNFVGQDSDLRVAGAEVSAAPATGLCSYKVPVQNFMVADLASRAAFL